LAIDFDPQAIRSAKKEKFSTLYGDAESPELYSELPLSQVKWVICCVSDLEAERVLVDALDELNYQGKTALISLKETEEKHHKSKQIHWWLKPFELAAERVVEKIREDCRG